MIDILKFKDGYCGQEGLVYGGRPRQERYIKGQLLIGLGNPFSWKKSKFVKGKVNNLEESLSAYRIWLFKLIEKYKKGTAKQELEAWERDYLRKVLALSQAIAQGQVMGIVCWCIQKKDYMPVKGLKDKECHTQILYGACLSLIEEKRVPKDPVVDLQTGKPINIFDFW
jgi:hypothetical protein